MDDSMVTARMLDEKKRKALASLREGSQRSQAINLMYDTNDAEEGGGGYSFEADSEPDRR